LGIHRPKMLNRTIAYLPIVRTCGRRYTNKQLLPTSIFSVLVEVHTACQQSALYSVLRRWESTSIHPRRADSFPLGTVSCVLPCGVGKLLTVESAPVIHLFSPTCPTMHPTTKRQEQGAQRNCLLQLELDLYVYDNESKHAPRATCMACPGCRRRMTEWNIRSFFLDAIGEGV
jgi:hypothetical protein